MKPILIILISLSCSGLLAAQDSSKLLSARQVMELVKQYHPVAKQASLIIKKAEADITIARGGFDPLLNNEHARKTFDGINYYNYNRPELTIPTWLGIELSTGLEHLSGDRTDPQDTKGQTSYAGISVPLAKNLLMDKRRAALKTAKIFRQASEAEQRMMLNNLLLDAMKAYWYWMQYYQVYTILDNAVQVNEKRTVLIKTGYRLGDRPAIDTTEALTQLQSFQVQRENAWMQFQNAGLELSVYLWSSGGSPLSIPADAVPADTDMMSKVSGSTLPEINVLLETVENNHPELQLYQFKLDALGVDRKLKFQQLLPSVNFRFNQLAKGYSVWKTNGPLFENNFRYGFYASIPLRFSEGRGEYRKAKLKIAETKLDQDMKLASVTLKVRTYFNELLALKNQVLLQEKAYGNYLALQRGEETRLQAGESSLFLVNARETKTLEALQKLQELRTKYFITLNALQWAAGLLV
jgi:outer membrane protein TolC